MFFNVRIVLPFQQVLIDALSLKSGSPTRWMWAATSGSQFYLSWASPPEEPAKTLFPSARVTLAALARFEPSLAREPFTVTVSPILMAFLVQPFLSNIAGEPSSISQFSSLPLASFASTKMRAWGLIQSSFVTGPLSVIGLLRSYCAANEWWAAAGTAA